jgi:hypothetical protein
VKRLTARGTKARASALETADTLAALGGRCARVSGR